MKKQNQVITSFMRCVKVFLSDNRILISLCIRKIPEFIWLWSIVLYISPLKIRPSSLSLSMYWRVWIAVSILLSCMYVYYCSIPSLVPNMLYHGWITHSHGWASFSLKPSLKMYFLVTKLICIKQASISTWCIQGNTLVLLFTLALIPSLFEHFFACCIDVLKATRP